jgi:eukaryotic-like serine/threonine-protein kinase
MATDVGSDELSDTAGGEHNQLQRLGKYRIEKRIGAGGMGTVFLAVDTDLNRTVALKVLPKDRAANPVLVRRFKAEGQAAAQMEHPNIVRVFEAGEADGFLYMALEYVEGIDVYELVERRGVIPVKRSTDIIRQTALALQHAHEKGIVHRDIKPSNLLIKRDGSVKLADMGLARSVDETLETNITRAGTTVGTVDYMSPEQARNSKAADVRSDIYSLGCTWYHMLTGHPPFPEGGMTNKLQAHAVSTRPDRRHHPADDGLQARGSI